MRVGETACREIVEQLLQERGLNGKDFFGNTRLQYYVDARVEAIKRMKANTPASHETIAFVLSKNASCIRYHMSEQNRRRRKEYYQSEKYKQYHAERRERRRQLKASSPSTTTSCSASTAPVAQTS